VRTRYAKLAPREQLISKPNIGTAEGDFRAFPKKLRPDYNGCGLSRNNAGALVQRASLTSSRTLFDEVWTLISVVSGSFRRRLFRP